MVRASLKLAATIHRHIAMLGAVRDVEFFQSRTIHHRAMDLRFVPKKGQPDNSSSSRTIEKLELLEVVVLSAGGVVFAGEERG